LFPVSFVHLSHAVSWSTTNHNSRLVVHSSYRKESLSGRISFFSNIMPQLDKFTYFTQFFWSCLFLFTFYIPFLLRSKRTTKVCLYLYNFTLFFVVFVRVVHFFSYQLFSYRQGGVCSAARFESAGLASFPRAGRSSSGNTAISYSC
jgi:hypothetical protein